MPKQDEALLERIFEAVPGGVVHVGPDGAIHRANHAAQAFLGFGYDELTERYTVDFAGATYFEDGTECGVEDYPVTQCLMTGQAQGPTTIGVEQPGGDVRWAVFRAIPGPEGSVVVSFVDITEHLEERRERDRLRMQLELAERLAAVGTLAAGVAHEINNPLMTIMGNLDLATLMLGDGQDKVLRRLAIARDASLRVAEIVRSMRQFARVDSPEAHAFEVGEAMQTAVTLCAPSVRSLAEVRVHPPTEELWALGHPGKVVQVVVNLVVNAAQSYEGAAAEQPTVELRAWADGEHVVVEVRDQGCGMAPAVLRRAVEPFFTTKSPNRGTGLGLAISHSLVEAMGGRLDLESREGHGTTATVWLPVAERVVEEEDEEAAPEAENERLDILVVDDEVGIRELCAEYLGVRHRVRTASDGGGALAQIEARVPDLVFCDLAMSPMDGAELYAVVRERWPELGERIVFMTGTTDLVRVRAFLERHRGRVLLKPFTLSRLTEVIEEICP